MGDAFRFVIEAGDQSAKAFGSALKGAQRFGSALRSVVGGAMRGLASIQAPVYFATENIRRVLEMGRAIGAASRDAFRGQVVQTEFARRLGIVESQAYKAARALQEASKGAMNLDETMEATNRLMAKGLSVDQIGKMFSYASIKSKTANIEFPEIVNGIASAFATGRTMGLKQLGLGMNLPKGANRADTIRATMAEMDAQMKQMGVTGNETVFTFDRMANSVHDVADAIVDAVAGSSSLASTMSRVNEVAGRFRDFLGQNADGFQSVVNSIVGALATGFKAIVGDVGRMFAGITPKGILETMTRISFAASKFMLTMRTGFLELKMGLLRFAAALIEDVAIPWAELFGLPKESFDRIVGAHQRINQEIRTSYREQHALLPLYQQIGQEEEDALARIRAMKDEALKIREPFEGLANKVRAFGRAMAEPFQKIGQVFRAGQTKLLAESAKTAVSSMADRIAEKFRAANDRVKELQDRLKELAGVERDEAAERERRRYEVYRADVTNRFGENSRQAREVDFQRAQQLFLQSQEAGRTPDEIKAMTDEALGLLMELWRNPAVARSPDARQQIEELMLAMENVRENRMVKGPRAEAERGIARAKQEAADAQKAQRAMQFEQAMAKVGLAGDSSSRQLRRFETAVVSATARIAALAAGGIGPVGPALEGAVRALAGQVMGR